MNFHVLTLFPEMIAQGLQTSILGRAVREGCITLDVVNIRDYTENKHKKVDDYPYGGGAGMLMQAQPVYDCYRAAAEKTGGRSRVIYLTPQGKPFHQKMAEEFSKEKDLIFLCGHYEGIDERVLEEIVTDYVSIGDYVLTGGELPAMVMIDAIARLVPGVLHNEISADFETFHNDLLEYPQYSRPEEWRGRKVPEVLLSGDHARIGTWRLEQSEARTRKYRPDMFEKYEIRQTCIETMRKKNKLLYMDMIESLRRGRGKLICCSEKGIIIEDEEAKLYMMAAFEASAAEELTACLPAIPENETREFVLHQEYLAEHLEKRFCILESTPFHQAVYTQRTAVPGHPAANLVIRPLDIGYKEEVMRHYHTVQDADYMEERLRSGNIYGAFLDGRLAGFAGVHREGSLGMLEVYEEYRRQGIGAALEASLINLHLSCGYTPYGDIIADNEKSEKLQNKMGLCLSRDTLYWVSAQAGTKPHTPGPAPEE